MRFFLGTYWLYIKTFFKARAEYKVSFFLGMGANFYCYFITYATFWVLISGLGKIGGWDFSDFSILYGLSLLTYAISGTLLWNTVYHLGEIITSGDLDVFLTRPLGIIKQLIFQRFGDSFLGQIVVTLIFLVCAVIKKNNHFSPLLCLYMIIIILSGVCIQAGGMIIIGSISFWTNRSEEIGDIFYYDIRSMTNYPLFIFPRWIQLGLTFVFPWAFINYYPSLIILDKIKNPQEFVLGLLSPLVGAIFLGLALFLFKKGLNKYSGAGN